MATDDDGALPGMPLYRLPDLPGRAPTSQCGGLRTVALVGSHGARPGGLATFTVELGEALAREWPALAHIVVAVDDRTRAPAPPASVRFAIAPADVSAYRRAADFLNVQDVDVVSVQWEGGLHGGPSGIYLLATLRELTMPVVTTFHTLPSVPERSQREVLDEVIRRSERVVVTGARTAQLLRDVYGVSPDKIDHIPGGGDRPTPAVARAYGRVFERARVDHAERRWRATDDAALSDRLLGVPPIELAFVSYLTDDAGMRRHGGDESPAGDHLLDDNARALALMTWLEQLGSEDRWTVSVLASRYLAFLVQGFDVELGRFRASLSAARVWTEQLADEDTHARALWALGTVVGRSRDRGRCHLAAQLFRDALPVTADFSSPIAAAYVLLGLVEYQRSFAGDADIKNLQRRLVQRISDQFAASATAERPWYEEWVGVESARVAQAMLVAGERLGEPQVVATGARGLAWLVAAQRLDDGTFLPHAVGLGDDGAPSPAQRPIDACATVSACLTALRTLGEEQWADEASRAYAWFLGANTAQRALYDPRTGACYDAVTVDRVDPAQGAEAVTSFLLASAEVRSALGAVADQHPCDLRQLARGTGSHTRQTRPDALLDDSRPVRVGPIATPDARAQEHAVAPAHGGSDPDS